MRQKELQPLPDQRQLIHDLVLRMHKSGLSPPEEEIVFKMEAQEDCAPSKVVDDITIRSSQKLLRIYKLIRSIET